MNRIKNMIILIFKAVALATGVAVVALLVMKSASIDTYLMMLGIGLSCASIVALMDKSKHKDD